MLTGDPPFKSGSGDPWDTFRRALSGKFHIPSFMSDDAADLIKRLLQVDPAARIGMGPAGISEIKQHRWLSKINWDNIVLQKTLAPYRPRIRSSLDTSNFEIFDPCESPIHPVHDIFHKNKSMSSLWEWVGDF